MPTETPERRSRPHLSVGGVSRPRCSEDLGGGHIVVVVGKCSPSLS